MKLLCEALKCFRLLGPGYILESQYTCGCAAAKLQAASLVLASIVERLSKSAHLCK